MPVASHLGRDIWILLELLGDAAAVLVPNVNEEVDRVAGVVKTA